MARPLQGSRKFLFNTLVIVLAFVLAIFSLLTPEFTTIAGIALGGFNWANAASSIASSKASSTE